MGRVGQARAPRAVSDEFLTIGTPKPIADKFKECLKLFNDRQAEVASVPKEVEPIDWNYWESAISAPGVVDQIRKEYETYKYEDIDTSFLSTINQENEDFLEMSKMRSPFAARELALIEEVQEEVTERGENMPYWDFDDWCKNMPGYLQQTRDEATMNMYGSKEGEKFLDLDFKQVASKMDPDDLEAGEYNPKDYPTPSRVGDLVYAEEESIKAKGEYSIRRLFRNREERAAIRDEVRELKNQGVVTILGTKVEEYLTKILGDNATYAPK